MPPTIPDLSMLIAFNDQLAALFEAGVPVGFVGNSTKLATELEKVNALLARRISQGESLKVALESEPSVPNWYRALVLSALSSGDVDSALSDYTSVATIADQADDVVQSAWIYPIIVIALAYCGIVAFCFFFVPSLQSTYSSFRIPAGSGLATLEFLRAKLPFWIALPPILLLLYIARQIRKRRFDRKSSRFKGGILARLSGASHALTLERSAYLAKSIAALDEQGVPLDDAIVLASGGSLTAGAANTLHGTPTKQQTEQKARVPPFLRWALYEAEPTILRRRALDMAAGLYHQASLHAMRRARLLAPMLLIVVIGGTVTLLYGLALFVPVVQMLKAIALTPVKNV
jgi:type II secretory pathway component PulF